VSTKPGAGQIDELPIVAKAENADEGSTEIVFDCENDRWNLARLWGDPQLVILPSLTGAKKFPMGQIDSATGAIRTDVGWRDRRLVLQSHSLAIVSPKPPGQDRITRGVDEEIQVAVPLGIMCNLWQNPEWDPEDFVGKRFPAAGSMGVGQTQSTVRKVRTLEELIRAQP
jgi:hypothetical protein